MNKMDIPSISIISNDTNPQLPGSPTNITDANILTNIDLSGSIPNFKASEIEAFDLKHNFEIAPHLAKYSSESNLATSNKKRKDNPNTLTAIESPPDLGLGGELQVTVWHTEFLIDRASLQALGREIQADQDQVEPKPFQIINELDGTRIPPWYCSIKLGKLATLQHRSVELVSHKTELEQRYHLLAAPNESVVARPAQW